MNAEQEKTLQDAVEHFDKKRAELARVEREARSPAKAAGGGCATLEPFRISDLSGPGAGARRFRDLAKSKKAWTCSECKHPNITPQKPNERRAGMCQTCISRKCRERKAAHLRHAEPLDDLEEEIDLEELSALIAESKREARAAASAQRHATPRKTILKAAGVPLENWRESDRGDWEYLLEGHLVEGLPVDSKGRHGDVLAWAASGSGPQTLLAAGDPGTGKSQLAADLLEIAWRAGASVLWTPASAVVDAARNTREELGKFRDVDFLVLDELQDALHAQWPRTQMRELIQLRRNPGKVTIITMHIPVNGADGSLEKSSKAIYDRLRTGYVILLEGDSKR